VTGARHRIIDAPGTNSGAAIAPDARRIALTMSFTGNTELYLTSIGGGRAKRLTQTPGVEASPSWSPDGRELVFASDLGGGGPGLFKISSSGGNPQPLRTGYRHCTEPDWSPDGKRVAFNALTGGQQVVVLDLASGDTTLIGPGENPSWGADSRHLVYARDGSLVMHNVDLGTSVALVTGAGRISEPSWTR
jgi:TolB protein